MSSDRTLDDAWATQLAQAKARGLIIPELLDAETEAQLRELGLVFKEAPNE